MTNEELMEQILAVMQQQTDTLVGMIDTKIKEAETRINVKIENDVGKRAKRVENRGIGVVAKLARGAFDGAASVQAGDGDGRDGGGGEGQRC